MNDTKKNKNFFPIIMGIFFLIFICLYFTGVSGAYQYSQYNKMIITEEAMTKFEKDIEEGKNINVENYLETVKDYSNVASKLGNKTSSFFESVMSEGIMKTFKLIGKLFT